MQSGYRADVGRNQMWSDFPTSRGIGFGVNNEDQFEQVDQENIYHKGDGNPEWTIESCEVLQPINPDGDIAEHIDQGEEYTGTTCIKA